LTKLSRERKPEHELLICSNKGKVFFRGDSKMGLIADDDSIYQGVEAGDLLIHGMDTWHGAIAISEYDGMCTGVVHVCDTKENKRYIMYYLQSLAFKKVYKKITNGVRENTSDFRSWDKAGQINLLLPPSEEQNEIARILDEKNEQIENLIVSLEQEISYIEELKTKTIADVVTGQIDVRNVIIPEYTVDETDEDFDSDDVDDDSEESDEDEE
jgi:type I restriction enzyme S subunit